MTIEKDIATLTLKREINKQQLFEKYAQQLRNKERFLVYGEHTDIKERIALDSEIAHLEADRQRTKVELLKLKMLVKDRRGESLVLLLIDALKKNGLQHEVDAATEKVNDLLREEGLLKAYSIQL